MISDAETCAACRVVGGMTEDKLRIFAARNGLTVNQARWLR
jgi:hypothetical protein